MDAALGKRLKELMVERQLTLAVAESLTSGNLQAAIGSISGASTFFSGGVTAYSLEQKVRLLAVDRAHAAAVNSVSERVAFELARGACALFRSDIGVGTTGYAEPSPAQSIEAPMAYFAIVRRRDEHDIVVAAHQLICPGLSRAEMQERVTMTALAALLSYLEGAG